MSIQPNQKDQSDQSDMPTQPIERGERTQPIHQTQRIPQSATQAAQIAAQASAQTAQSPTDADTPSLFMYSTTVSDVGTVRSNNQDSSFAGERLIAVCDGMGGHAGGDTASTIAIRSLAHIEQDNLQGDIAAVAKMMVTSVMAAHDAIVGKAKRERRLAGMGTTVVAVTLVAGYWVLAHIGDSRAYLLRDGKLTRMTTDHSYVQHLIDTGRITESEARNHPQRNVVMRVLGDFDIDSHPDVAIRKARPTDRWLLCSDGLCGVLEDATLQEALSTYSSQDECAQRLVAMALRAGSTDNVTAVIADATYALDEKAFDLPHQTPLVGGAASASLEPIADIINEPVASAPALRSDEKESPAQRAAALMQGMAAQTEEESEPEQHIAQPSTVREERGILTNPDTGEIPVVQKTDGRVTSDPNDPEVASAIRNEQLEQRKATRAKSKRARFIVLIITLLTLLALTAAAVGTYYWSQTKYYLGDNNGSMTIFQGIPTSVFGFELSHPIESTGMKTSDMPQSWRQQLERGITVDSYDEALQHADLIKTQVQQFEEEKNSKDPDASKKSDTTTSDDAADKSSGADKTTSDTTDAADGSTAGNSADDKQQNADAATDGTQDGDAA